MWLEQAIRVDLSLDVREQARKISAETLLIAAKYDQVVPSVYSEELGNLIPGSKRLEIHSSAAAWHNQEVLRLIRTMEAADTNRNVPRQWFALVYAEIGDEANTAKWLNRSADAHEWQVLNAAVHPFYKNMQNSPEFRTLKRRIGLEL